jgi:nitroimidazol reductase NimA-like FMN-containing flavoprotein (pyridoxamine 5'-phosphate oxidase superfamily)
MKIDVLSGDECRQLLGRTEVGRLAVVIGGYPEVFPVNYTVVRDRVLIRTDPGAKLSHAEFERVCFEVDDLDPFLRTGWSVLVKGVVHEMDEGDRLDHENLLAASRIAPWVGGDKAHVLVITPVSITGRRIVRGR